MRIYMSITFLVCVQSVCLAVFVSIRRRERVENQRRHFLECLEKALVRPVG